jgi:cobalt-zinc-cadmium efflux system outer membrane protein
MVAERAGRQYEWISPSQSGTALDIELQQRVQTLLRQPLSAEAAVQIALLRNPRLQIEYARLGVAAADVLEASQLSNPTLSTRVLAPLNGNYATLIGGGLAQSFSDLLLRHARKRLGVGEYQRAELLIAAAIFELTADVRTAWYSAVGAQQVAAMRATMAAAAQTAAELAGRFHDAGNISDLQLTLERAAAAHERLASTRARADATRARAALNELLGLDGEEAHWTIAEKLPVPVPREDAAETLLAIARSQRLDLLAARREVALLEQSLATTRRYRWLGRVDAGVEAERDDDRARLVGPSLTFEVPLFNQGQAAIARARALLDEQRGRLRALEVSVDNAVRLGVERVEAAREIAEDYRSALIPERDSALASAQENANYMLIGTFELLATKQEQYAAYQGYLEAVRDYWLARIELMRSVGARLPSETPTDAITGDQARPQEILP